MYTSVLSLHSLLRWVVLAVAVATILRSLGARDGSWTALDDKLNRWFVMSLDIQLVLGVTLYFFLSPFTTAALPDFGGAMRQSGLRFWAVEHPTLMLAALLVAHIGRVRVKKATTGAAKHRKALIFTAVALLAILLSIPWPGMANGRPLLRLG